MLSKCKSMKTLGFWPNFNIDGLEKRRKKIELRAFLPPTVATIQVVEDLKTFSTHHIPSPPNGPINGDAITSTIEQETPMNIEVFKQVSLNYITTTLLDGSDLDFDNCTLPEVTGFLHKMSRDPH